MIRRVVYSTSYAEWPEKILLRELEEKPLARSCLWGCREEVERGVIQERARRGALDRPRARKVRRRGEARGDQARDRQGRGPSRIARQ